MENVRQSPVEMLAQLIAKQQLKVRKPRVKCTKTMDPMLMAQKMVVALRPLLFGSQPLTNLGGHIGKVILQGTEDLSKGENAIERARIEVGIEYLKPVFANQLLKFKRSEKERNNPMSLAKLLAHLDKHDLADRDTQRDPYIVSEVQTVVEEQRQYKRGGSLKTRLVKRRQGNALLQGMFAEIKSSPIQLATTIASYKPLHINKFIDHYGGQLVSKLPLHYADKYSIVHTPKIYQIINYLNTTPRILNEEMFRIVSAIQEEIGSYPKLKERIKNEGNKKLKEKLEAALIGRQRELNISMDFAMAQLGKTFYEYHYIDFRTRVYPRANYFNHASSKLNKSLFLFKDKKKLGAKGWNELLIHIANCYGKDKLTLEKRIAFVEDNIDLFVDMTRDPIDDRRWMEADDAFGFLAAIIELRNAVDSGNEYEYESGLPCAIDSSCSAVQVFCLLTRNRKYGKLCNLTRTSKRGDYYDYIGGHTWKRLEASDDPRAQLWLSLTEKQRAIVKRSAMVYFYNAGPDTMGDNIFADFFTEDGFEMMSLDDARFLGKMIYEVCEEEMGELAALKALFTRIGLDHADRNEDLIVSSWATKAPMVQVYRQKTSGRISVFLPKKMRLRYNLVDPKDRIVMKHVKQGSCPNLTHFHDAQIVHQTILKAIQGGYAISTIHDSFSTVPGSMDQLRKDVRQATVDIFSVDQLKRICKELNCEHYLTDGFTLGGNETMRDGEPYTTPIHNYKIQFGDLDVEELKDNQFYCA